MSASEFPDLDELVSEVIWELRLEMCFPKLLESEMLYGPEELWLHEIELPLIALPTCEESD